MRGHIACAGVLACPREPGPLSARDEDGLPLIGAYVAAGHSVWGILNAIATCEAVAELILDGAARAVDLSAFDPVRLEATDANGSDRAAAYTATIPQHESGPFG